MKKFLFISLCFLSSTLLCYETQGTHIREIYTEEVNFTQNNFISLDDGTIWNLLDLEGTDLSTWKEGDYIAFHRPPHYLDHEYRLVNTVQVSSVRVVYHGRQ